jgi:hypothetical protein
MDALEIIRRLAQEIAVYGNHEVLVGDKPINSIVQDYKSTLVSAGEVSETEVFRLITGEAK